VCLRCSTCSYPEFVRCNSALHLYHPVRRLSVWITYVAATLPTCAHHPHRSPYHSTIDDPLCAPCTHRSVCPCVCVCVNSYASMRAEVQLGVGIGPDLPRFAPAPSTSSGLPSVAGPNDTPAPRFRSHAAVSSVTRSFLDFHSGSNGVSSSTGGVVSAVGLSSAAMQVGGDASTPILNSDATSSSSAGVGAGAGAGAGAGVGGVGSSMSGDAASSDRRELHSASEAHGVVMKMYTDTLAIMQQISVRDIPLRFPQLFDTRTHSLQTCTSVCSSFDHWDMSTAVSSLRHGYR